MTIGIIIPTKYSIREKVISGNELEIYMRQYIKYRNIRRVNIK